MRVDRVRTLVSRGLAARPRGLSAPWLWLVAIVLIELPSPVMILGQGALNPMQFWPLTLFPALAVALVVGELWALSAGLATLLAWAAVRTLLNLLDPLGLFALGRMLVAAILLLRVARADDRSAHWMRRGILVILAVHALIGMAQMSDLPGINRGAPADVPDVPEHDRAWGLFYVRDHVWRVPVGLMSSPNDWGLLMAAGVPMLWSLVARRRLLVQGVVLALGVGVVATSHSRQATGIAALIAVGVLAVRAAPRLPWRRLLLALGAVTTGLVAAGGLLWLDPGHFGTLRTWATGWGAREPVWQLAYAEASRLWPMIGHGLGAWPRWVYRPDSPVRALIGDEWLAQWYDARGDLVQLGFELGVLGLLMAGLAALELGTGVLVAAARGHALDLAWAAMATTLALGTLAGAPLHDPQLALLAVLAAGRVLPSARSQGR